MDLYCTGNVDRLYIDHLFIQRVKLVLVQCEKAVEQLYNASWFSNGMPLCDSICLNPGLQQHLVYWSTSKIPPPHLLHRQ